MDVAMEPDSEHSLERVIETLSARFPSVQPGEIAEYVYATYSRLKQEASIGSHLAALTQRAAAQELSAVSRPVAEGQTRRH
jgi:hypothetical protein